MIGKFINYESCKEELRNQCFKFSHIGDEGRHFYTNEAKMNIAEVYVYKDGSVSALIGKYIVTKLNIK